MASTTYQTQRDRATGGTIFSVSDSRVREFRELVRSVEPVFRHWTCSCIVYAPRDRIQKLRAYLLLNGWTDVREEQRIMQELAGRESEDAIRFSAESFGLGVPGSRLGKS